MPDDNSTTQRLAAKIVGADLRRHQVPPDQLATLISTVHQALGQLAEPATEAEGPRTPAVSIRRSVHRDHVICLDCGWKAWSWSCSWGIGRNTETGGRKPGGGTTTPR